MSINGYGTTTAETQYGNGDIGGTEDTPLLGNGVEAARAKGASFASAVFNLMNAIMGSGILGLAYAMASTGIAGFCILLLIVATLAAFSIHLLLKLCDQTGINTYEELGKEAFNKPGKILVAVTILVQNIGAMASYMFILRAELPPSIDSFLNTVPNGAWYEGGRTLVILVTVCVVLPLALLPKIGFLGYSSSLSFFFMLYFTVVVVVKKWSIPCPLPHNETVLLLSTSEISNSSDSECEPKYFIISTKSAYAMPTMAFSFLCHTAVLPIYSELDRPSKKKMQNVANTGISLSFLLYLISALFGYLTFFGNVHSELFQNYNNYLPHDIVILTVRLAILLAVLLTIPLICFPARKAAYLMLFGDRPFSWLVHIITTVVILSIVVLLAILVPDIRQVFGIVGSTTSTCLLFVYPGLFYLKLSNRPFKSFDYFAAGFLLVFGLFLGVVSLTVIVISSF